MEDSVMFLLLSAVVSGVLLHPLAKQLSGKYLFHHIFGTRPLPPLGPTNQNAPLYLSLGGAGGHPRRIPVTGSTYGPARGGGGATIQMGGGVVGTPLSRGYRAGSNAGAAGTPHMSHKLLQQQRRLSGAPMPPAIAGSAPHPAKATGAPWRLRCIDRGVLPLLRQMIGVSIFYLWCDCGTTVSPPNLYPAHLLAAPSHFHMAHPFPTYIFTASSPHSSSGRAKRCPVGLLLSKHCPLPPLPQHGEASAQDGSPETPLPAAGHDTAAMQAGTGTLNMKPSGHTFAVPETFQQVMHSTICTAVTGSMVLVHRAGCISYRG